MSYAAIILFQQTKIMETDLPKSSCNNFHGVRIDDYLCFLNVLFLLATVVAFLLFFRTFNQLLCGIHQNDLDHRVAGLQRFIAR